MTVTTPPYIRKRWEVRITGQTWLPGWETRRTYIGPWEVETLIRIIPAIQIAVQWRWHCSACRAEYAMRAFPWWRRVWYRLRGEYYYEKVPYA